MPFVKRLFVVLDNQKNLVKEKDEVNHGQLIGKVGRPCLCG